jgi:hypothetical protein
MNLIRKTQKQSRTGIHTILIIVIMAFPLILACGQSEGVKDRINWWSQ